MNKLKSFIGLSLSVLLLLCLCFLLISFSDFWSRAVLPTLIVLLAAFGIWAGGSLWILLRKSKPGKVFSGFAKFFGIGSLTVIVLFCGLCFLADLYPYQGSFSLETSLFSDKNVMILIPHQDDEINLAGGLIEQYTAAGSEVTVVFTTNGDRFGESQRRAGETLCVMSELGVKKENICYLGFGDLWQGQTYGDRFVSHIYNSPDPDALWMSTYGATATYGTETIPCYQELAYTRSNYLSAIRSILLQKRPDTLFVVDFDSHLDHRAASLLFEEAMGEILKEYPDYHPAVYKGFCYGTAWEAPSDYFADINLLSTVKPYDYIWEETDTPYRWEDRLRFPLSERNLNPVLSGNSVYKTLASHASQSGDMHATQVLNGDKVFWQRRTDSLLHQAEVFVGNRKTGLLNDFKLRDYPDITDITGQNCNLEVVSTEPVRIRFPDTVTANTIHLYDDPDDTRNILAGYLAFSDGSRVDFSALNPDGTVTVLSFPKTNLSDMEIVVTDYEGDWAGLCEVELFYDEAAASDTADSFIMPVDSDGNFVYDYTLQENDTLALQLFRYPSESLLTAADVQVTFESTGADSACFWDGDLLVIHCAEKEECKITLSQDSLRTAFTVSNPSRAKLQYETLLRSTDRVCLNMKTLAATMKTYFWYLFTGQMFRS